MHKILAGPFDRNESLALKSQLISEIISFSDTCSERIFQVDINRPNPYIIDDNLKHTLHIFSSLKTLTQEKQTMESWFFPGRTS